MVKRKKPGPRATQDPRVVPLLALQDELGLTPFQCRFVEALAVDPERNQTRAAIVAGAPRKGAAAQASRLLTLVKVQKYFHALTTEAEEGRAQGTQAAVAGLAEVLTMLTAQMRVRAGDYVVPSMDGGYVVDAQAVRAARPGLITGDLNKLKLADSQGAAKALLAHYTDKPLVAGGGNVTLNTVINGLSDELVTALFRAMALASGRQPAGLLGAGAEAHGQS